MKIAELRGLSGDELSQKGRELRDQLFNAKVKHATGQLEDSAKLNTLRRDIARIETLRSEKSRDEV